MMDRAPWTMLRAPLNDAINASLDLPWTYGMILRGVKSMPMAEKTTAAVFYLLCQNSSLFQHNELNFFKTCRFAIKMAPKTVPFQSQWIHSHLSPRLHSLWFQIEPILEDTLALLNYADQHILLLRFYKSISINEIGSILNLSPFQVHHSMISALKELMTHFKHQGLDASIDLESLLTLMLTQVRVAPSRRLVVLVENLLLQNEPDIQVLSIARSTSKALSNAAHRLLNRLKPAAIS